GLLSGDARLRRHARVRPVCARTGDIACRSGHRRGTRIDHRDSPGSDGDGGRVREPARRGRFAMSARSFRLVVGLLLVSLAGAAAAESAAKMARIGLISVGTDSARPGPPASAFAQALRTPGYTGGGDTAHAPRLTRRT